MNLKVPKFEGQSSQEYERWARTAQMVCQGNQYTLPQTVAAVLSAMTGQASDIASTLSMDPSSYAHQEGFFAQLRSRFVTPAFGEVAWAPEPMDVSAVWCKVHKMATHSDQDCRAQKGSLAKAGPGKGHKPRRKPKPTDVCRTCKGQGHWARDCPQRPQKYVGTVELLSSQPRRLRSRIGTRRTTMPPTLNMGTAGST